jgi:hypothetical protein
LDHGVYINYSSCGYLMDALEVLCTAGIHIGRRPSRLPDRFDSAEFSPREVWADLAATAVNRNVDGVVVAGDLVDNENRYAEAFGAVEAVATTLAEADIPLVVVAGGGVQIRVKDEAVRFLSGQCSKSHASTVVATASS